MRSFYERRLHASLDYRPVTYVFAVLILLAGVGCFMTAKSELAPTEDQGVLFAQSTPAPTRHSGAEAAVQL